ncbi:ribonuclease III [Flaviflagellibacter deserti]|uniref:Ribonuclease 3 n=1 Tax=Flaviflagellibacter deserti TaxID=2267266 RepID=A0ABV9Z0H2_9HYPH
MKNPRAAARSGLEARLGYQFADPALLDHALTHVSAVKGDNPRTGSYQRFEFLGDRVLGLVVAELLFKTFPDVPEGELSQRLSELVSAETCAQVAAELGIGEAVKLGEGEARSGGRKKKALLADVCESVIAAVYLDGGLEPARDLIHRNWQGRMLRPRKHLRDGKTALQEWAHGRGLATPDYREIGRTGPDHHPVFQVEVFVSGGEPARGEGRTKRVAEKAAAEAFLIREGIWTNEAVHD